MTRKATTTEIANTIQFVLEIDRAAKGYTPVNMWQ